MKEFWWGVKIGIIVYLLYATISNLMDIRILGEKLVLLENKVNGLQSEVLYTRMEVGTNKLLLKETQRLVVPNEVALKENISWQKKQ